MSKPKGRRKPLHSEITSLRRATEAAEAGVGSAPETLETDEGAIGDANGADAVQSPEPSAAGGSSAGGQVSAEPLLVDLEPEVQQVQFDLSAPETEDVGAGSIATVADRADAFEQSSTGERPASNVISIDGEEPDDMEVFLCGLIEALLFTSQRPLPLKEIARAAGIDRPRARELLERLIAGYSPRGINIDEVAGGYVLRSSARYAPQIQKFLALRPVRLSRAQLETLAIVAYRQPVTKPEVDDIRGVDSGQVLKGLMERSLLKILGKKDEPGRPMLYGTTNDFLELLNLRSLGELPTLREYTELSDESRQKFADETGEEAPNELPLPATNTNDEPASAESASDGSLSEATAASGDTSAAQALGGLEQEPNGPSTGADGLSSEPESESVASEPARAAREEEEEKEEDEDSDEDDDEDSDEDDDESDEDADEDSDEDDDESDEDDDDSDEDDDDSDEEEDDDDEDDDDDDEDDDDDDDSDEEK